jgi:hypothetical protein
MEMTVSGDLRDMDLSSIISINCNQMNQARLLIRRQRREARIFFQDGKIVHMSLGSKEGEEVIHEILTWEEGVFELERGIPAPRRTVTKGWSELLLGGMQRLDEGAAPEEAVEAGEMESYVREVVGARTGTADLRVIAKTLFQGGLDLGLSPDQAALQVSDAKLPASITDKAQREFKEWLIEACRERFDEQVEELRRRMGLQEEHADQGDG